MKQVIHTYFVLAGSEARKRYQQKNYTNGSSCGVANPGSGYLHWYHEENVSCSSVHLLYGLGCLYVGRHISQV
jgi:hypothetical protein